MKLYLIIVFINNGSMTICMGKYVFFAANGLLIRGWPLAAGGWLERL
jgi:hypothetical protein